MEKPSLNVDKVFVAHVKSGYEARRKFMEEQLGRLGIAFEYMLDGDISDITPAIKDRWFLPKLIANPKMMSCTCKHFFIYEKMVRDGLANALILEDDIFLSQDFVPQVNRSIDELFSREGASPSKAWISYENSTLRFPPKSTLSADKLLYPALDPRCTGAYYVGVDAARSIVEVADRDKVSLGIDIFVGTIVKRNPSPVELYWCHPTIAEQGSMNGVFDSIDVRRKSSLWRKVLWNADKCYKVGTHYLSLR